MRVKATVEYLKGAEMYQVVGMEYYYILTEESKRNPALFFAHEFGIRTLTGALVGNPKSRFMEEKFGSKLSSACVGDGQRVEVCRPRKGVSNEELN